MLAQSIIVFRETLEAVLVLGIIYVYLKKLDKVIYTKYLLLGGVIAVIVSLMLGIGTYYTKMFVGLEKELMEAIAAFIAVPVLTYVVYWMLGRGSRIREEIRQKVIEVSDRVKYSSRTYAPVIAFAGLGFLVVFREGLETVLFMLPFIIGSPLDTILGIFVGLTLASAIGYGVARGAVRLNLRRFFLVTSILLVLIAGGLLGYGVHELMEYYEDQGIDFGLLGEPLYDLGIASTNPLSHKGVIGSIFAVLFGYTTKMEILRALIQIPYSVIGVLTIYVVHKKRLGST
jgi:high-affinity iron transporter